MQGETRFKMKVQRLLDQIPKLYHQKIQQKAIRGTLDLIICYRGYFINWELKTDDGHLSALQIREIAKVRNAGGIAMVVTPSNLQESIDFIVKLPQNTRSKP
jgi:hypothetical protein